MAAADVAGTQAVLRAIAGVRDVRVLDDEARRMLLRIESDCEAEALLPVRNIGVRCAAERTHTLVVLKDGGFRPPPVPTVYMVEEASGAYGDAAHSDAAHGEGAHVEGAHAPDCAAADELAVEGVRYRVIGREITGPADIAGREVIYLSDRFVMFPRRRTGPRVPCWFMLPPIPFPELESVRARLGISRIVSVSPSLAADSWLRDLFDLPRRNDLATLLVGFDDAC